MRIIYTLNIYMYRYTEAFFEAWCVYRVVCGFYVCRGGRTNTCIKGGGGGLRWGGRVQGGDVPFPGGVPGPVRSPSRFFDVVLFPNKNNSHLTLIPRGLTQAHSRCDATQ